MFGSDRTGAGGRRPKLVWGLRARDPVGEFQSLARSVRALELSRRVAPRADLLNPKGGGLRYW